MPIGVYKRKPLSEATKLKISLGNKGKHLGLGYWTGKKRSEEDREKMRKAKLGKKQTPEQIRKRFLWQKGYHHSEETRRKMSKSNVGKHSGWNVGSKNVNWKGGITPINEKIRKSLEYNIWRRGVFERDNWTCIFCGIKGVKIHADHIKPFALYPELRFAIDNGRTLCIPCHLTTDTYGYKTRKLL